LGQHPGVVESIGKGQLRLPFFLGSGLRHRTAYCHTVGFSDLPEFSLGFTLSSTPSFTFEPVPARPLSLPDPAAVPILSSGL